MILPKFQTACVKVTVPLLLVYLSSLGSLHAATAPTFTDGIYSKFGLDLADAGRNQHWALFVYGSGTSGSPFTALDVSSASSSSPYLIDGDIALAGAYSRLAAGSYGLIASNRYERQTSSESVQSGAALTGSRFTSSYIDSAANQAILALKNVSMTAGGLTKTTGSPGSIALSGGSATYNNNPFGGKYVMRLSDLALSNNATLTLKGVAGSAFVINVSGNFSLTSGAKIVLSGGLTSSDVLFNVTGGSGAFSITGDSIFNGTLLAYNSAAGGGQRALTVGGANTQVNGGIIANRVVMNGGKVKKPKKKSKGDQDGNDDDDDGQHGHHDFDKRWRH